MSLPKKFKWKHFAPEIILLCLRWYGSPPVSYANLNDMPDFYFYHKRNKEAAYQFLRRCLRHYDSDNQSKTLNTDKHSSYANAIARLKKEGRLRADVKQRQVKSLNNGIESDHVPIKKIVVATGGFKIRKRAWSTIQGANHYGGRF